MCIDFRNNIQQIQLYDSLTNYTSYVCYAGYLFRKSVHTTEHCAHSTEHCAHSLLPTTSGFRFEMKCVAISTFQFPWTLFGGESWRTFTLSNPCAQLFVTCGCICARWWRTNPDSKYMFYHLFGAKKTARCSQQ